MPGARMPDAKAMSAMARAAILVIRSGLAHLLCTIFRYGTIEDSTGLSVRPKGEEGSHLFAATGIDLRPPTRLPHRLGIDSAPRFAYTGWGWVISSSTRPLVSTPTRMSATEAIR